VDFFQKAYKGNNDWYTWMVTIILVFLFWQILGVMPLIAAAFSHTEDFAAFTEAANNNFMNIGINKNLYLFLIITMFIFALIGLVIGVKYVHKRTLKSIITSRDKVDWKRIWFAFILWAIVATIATVGAVALAPDNYVFNFKPVPFFTLVIISFLFLPFQTSFEEFLFRGYFMQGLGMLVKNRLFPLLMTSVFFGLLHGANPEVEKLGQITMVFYIGTGLFFGITTLMDEGIELALGLHAANNIIAAFLVTTDWTVFQTDALFIDTSEPSVTWEMFVPVLVFYPAMLLIFSKKYGWKNWGEKLAGRIQKPENVGVLD
tara:strand:- start:160353 stop:161303 length:951 start_codon:yes stop_codon:yes gene_type:complete